MILNRLAAGFGAAAMFGAAFCGTASANSPYSTDTVARLTIAQQAQADDLAQAIEQGVRAALVAHAGKSLEEQQSAAEDAIQSALEISNASPKVARAALLKARGRLMIAGLLCDANWAQIRPPAKPAIPGQPAETLDNGCAAVAGAFAVAMSAIDAADATGTVYGDGPSPIGSPPPPGNGPGGGTTHPPVSRAAN